MATFPVSSLITVITVGYFLLSVATSAIVADELVDDSSAGADSLIGTLRHVIRDDDIILTDPNEWTIDADDFRCLVTDATTNTTGVVELNDEYLCDKKVDCDDGGDEAENVCLELELCPGDKKKCPLERKCISSSQLCDGVSDCTADAWDEREFAGCPTGAANSSKLECPQNLFACATNGKCLSQSDLCNYKWDCEDGSDEDVSRCPNGRRCPEGFFRCYKTDESVKSFYDHCISIVEVCNQIVECPNYEDELPDYSKCTPDQRLAIILQSNQSRIATVMTTVTDAPVQSQTTHQHRTHPPNHTHHQHTLASTVEPTVTEEVINLVDPRSIIDYNSAAVTTTIPSRTLIALSFLLILAIAVVRQSFVISCKL